MVLQQMRNKVYTRQWFLEDEEYSRNYHRSIRPIRTGIFFERSSSTLMETPRNKYHCASNKVLGYQVQQKNMQLHRNASSSSKRENTRRRSRVLGEWQKNIFLAGKREQDRIQVLWSSRKTEHGELPTLKPPDKEKML